MEARRRRSIWRAREWLSVGADGAGGAGVERSVRGAVVGRPVEGALGVVFVVVLAVVLAADLVADLVVSLAAAFAVEVVVIAPIDVSVLRVLRVTHALCVLCVLLSVLCVRPSTLAAKARAL